MTPVFGHGRLRLYLLKLLDESPRHGYEIIRLLQDRFLGLYAPSAGTVYPRLAKLEQEGLVTHSVEGGRKVYRITEAGRAELAERQPELDALESEIRESVYERAREIRDEVRTSARNLREELRQATRDMQGGTGRPGASEAPWGRGAGGGRTGGKDDPVSAWAKNIGPALSQKMVDLAEGLAQGLAGLTEQHTQHLEDELRRRFGTEGDPGAARGRRGKGTGEKSGADDTWRAATEHDASDTGTGGGAGTDADTGADTDTAAETTGGTAAGGAADSDTAKGEDAGTGSHAGSGDSAEPVDCATLLGPRTSGRRAPRGGAEELGRLFDRFRTEIDAAAGRAGLTPSQVDRARDVLVRACTDLKDILNER